MKHFSLITLILTLLMTSMTTQILFASSDTDIKENQSSIDEHIQIREDGSVQMTRTEADDFTSRFEQKGYEIINFLRRISQPLAILAFLIGALMIVAGQITGSRMKNTGMMVLLFTAISYAGIVFAPEILDAFISWIRT